MALIKCPECSNEVSQHAGSCPKCGYPIAEYVKTLRECPECKTLISREENICPICGYNRREAMQKELERARKELEEKKQKEHEELVRTGKIKEFPLYGEMVDISNTVMQELKGYWEFERIEEIEKCVVKELNEAIKKRIDVLSTEYEEKEISSFENYFNFFADYFAESISNISDIILEGFAPVKKLNKDLISELYDEYEDRLMLPELHQAMYATITEIESSIAQDKAIRDFKKNGRGRVTAGGFNLKSMIGGMALAGITNAAIGGLYELGNTMANDKMARSERQKFINAINGKEFLGGLVKATENDLRVFISVVESISDILIEEKQNKFGRIIDFSKMKKDILADKRKVQNGTREEKIDFIVNALSDYPVLEDIYLFSLEEIGDSNKELEKIGKYVGVNNIPDMKSDLLEKKTREISARTDKYGDEYREALVQYSEKIGIDLSLQENADKITSYVDLRNQEFVRRATGDVNVENVEDLKKAITILQEIDLQEAKEKIDEYKLIIEQIEKMEEIQQIVNEGEYSSIASLNEIIKKVEELDGIQIDENIYNELLSQKAEKIEVELKNEKIFIKDPNIREQLQNERKKICDIYLAFNGDKEKQYDSVISSLKQLDGAIYDISKEIDQFNSCKEEIRKIQDNIFKLDKEIEKTETELSKLPAIEELSGCYKYNCLGDDTKYNREVDAICPEKKILQRKILRGVAVAITTSFAFLLGGFAFTKYMYIFAVILGIIAVVCYYYYNKVWGETRQIIKEYEKDIVNRKAKFKKILISKQGEKQSLEDSEIIQGKKSLEPILKIKPEVNHVQYDGYAILSILQGEKNRMRVHKQHNVPRIWEATLYCYDNGVCQEVTYKKIPIRGGAACIINGFKGKLDVLNSGIWILFTKELTNLDKG